MLSTFEDIAFSSGTSRWWCVCCKHIFSTEGGDGGYAMISGLAASDLSNPMFHCALRGYV